MANQEQLKILLEEGVEAWNRWVSNLLKAPSRKINTDLSFTNLSFLNLEGANFTNVNLEGANLEGANLEGANLDFANFRAANLKEANLETVMVFNANFKEANLEGANFNGNTRRIITQANFQNANLKRVNLSKLDLSELLFSGIKLSEANLREANLREANLIGAELIGTDLSGANLREVRALGVNFNGAVFTGACIQDWNINSGTNLENVICDYIYFREGGQERRPSDPDRNFKPGEFAKLVQKSLSTVDLIFSEGIDWQGFLDSFKKLQVEDGNGELVIQAIERKTGGAFVVRVEVPPDADKSKIEASFWQKYNPLLEAKNREIKLLSQQTDFYSQQVEFIRTDNTRLMGIVETMAEKENAKYDLRGAKFGGGFAADGGTQSGGTLNDYSITIGQNIDDIERLIASLRKNIQHFPEEQREDAEMELEDLEEEIKNPEKQNPKRLGKRLKRIAAIGAAVTALTGDAVTVSDNLNTFTDNVTELGEKLEIPIESIKANLED